LLAKLTFKIGYYATLVCCFWRVFVTESVYLIGVELNPPAADRQAFTAYPRWC